MRMPHAAAHGGLLTITSFFLLPLLGPTATARPVPGFFQDLGSQLGSQAGQALDTGVHTLIALLTALESGQTTQNGLVGNSTVAVNTTETTGAANGTTTTTLTISAKVATCPDVAVIFARGTKEPGNMGFVAGPPFASALQAYANNSRVAIQGVDYAASVRGFVAGGDADGAALMAALVDSTAAQCPDAKLVLAGYSQGALVTRKALAALGPAASANASAPALSHVDSVVLFGDPLNGTALPPGIDPARAVTFCHAGDDVCKGGSLVLAPHLDYSSDAPAAALFVMQNTGLGLGGRDAVGDGMGGIPMMTAPKGGMMDGLAGQAVMDLMKDRDENDGGKGSGGAASALLSMFGGRG